MQFLVTLKYQASKGDKTMADKLMYITNDDTQNFLFFLLQSITKIYLYLPGFCIFCQKICNLKNLMNMIRYHKKCCRKSKGSSSLERRTDFLLKIIELLHFLNCTCYRNHHLNWTVPNNIKAQGVREGTMGN